MIIQAHSAIDWAAALALPSRSGIEPYLSTAPAVEPAPTVKPGIPETPEPDPVREPIEPAPAIDPAKQPYKCPDESDCPMPL